MSYIPMSETTNTAAEEEDSAVPTGTVVGAAVPTTIHCTGQSGIELPDASCTRNVGNVSSKNNVVCSTGSRSSNSNNNEEVNCKKSIRNTCADSRREGRKKRQKKRPRSEFSYICDVESNTTNNNFANDRGIIITPLTIRNSNNSNYYNSNDNNSNDNETTEALTNTFTDQQRAQLFEVQDRQSSSLQLVQQLPAPAPPPLPLVRIVLPYPYTFTSYCKERWIGRTIYDIYCTEFGSYPPSYYSIAIQQGRIRVNDTIVSCQYIVQAKDVLMHIVHRHEPAVMVQSNAYPYVTIVHEAFNDNKSFEHDDDLIAIDKPSTLPIHPCGGYARNSLMNLLQESNDKDNNDISNNNKLYTIHRLDRLTSGLVVLAKSTQTAKIWGQAIQQRDCQKVYLARVIGRFGTNLLRRHLDNSKTNSRSIPHLQFRNDIEIPQYGEYSNTTAIDLSQHNKNNDTKDTDTFSEVQIRRQKYAYGYWMTDAQTGHVIKDDPNNSIQNNIQLLEHSIDEWMQVIDNTTTTTTNGMENENISVCNTLDNHHPFIWFNIACPVRIEQPKIGVCSAGIFDSIDDAIYIDTVKPAQTRFGIVQYDSITDSTIIIVQPMTGRTHQIRVHLQHIQHSIANDPNYGGQLWFGNPRGKMDCVVAQKELDGCNDNDVVDEHEESCTDRGLVTSDAPATNNEIQNTIQCVDGKQNDTESLSDWIQRTCVWCNRLYGTPNNLSTSKSCSGVKYNRNKNDIVVRRAMLEFLVRSPGLWLHAFQYTVKGRSFRTKIPDWCKV